MFTPHNMLCVMCHMSRVTCHMSCVTCKKKYGDKVVELVGGGSVITGVYPV